MGGERFLKMGRMVKVGKFSLSRWVFCLRRFFSRAGLHWPCVLVFFFFERVGIIFAQKSLDLGLWPEVVDGSG